MTKKKCKKTDTYDIICSQCNSIKSIKFKFSDKAVKDREGIDESITKQLNRKGWEVESHKTVCPKCIKGK